MLLNKKLLIQKLNNKISLFDSNESVLYSFNETATFILNKLKLKWTPVKISEALSKKYRVSIKEAKRDTDKIVTDLLKRKILVNT